MKSRQRTTAGTREREEILANNGKSFSLFAASLLLSLSLSLTPLVNAINGLKRSGVTVLLRVLSRE